MGKGVGSLKAREGDVAGGVGADGADGVGRLAIGVGRFHQPFPRVVGALEQAIIPQVVGSGIAWERKGVGSLKSGNGVIARWQQGFECSDRRQLVPLEPMRPPTLSSCSR